MLKILSKSSIHESPTNSASLNFAVSLSYIILLMNINIIIGIIILIISNKKTI